MLAVKSAHQVTLETLGTWGGSVSPVSVITTSMCWTQSRVMPELASACAAYTTARAPPARIANWVTTATPWYRTAGVSALVSLGIIYSCGLTIELHHCNIGRWGLDLIILTKCVYCLQSVFVTSWAAIHPAVPHLVTVTATAAVVSVTVS